MEPPTKAIGTYRIVLTLRRRRRRLLLLLFLRVDVDRDRLVGVVRVAPAPLRQARRQPHRREQETEVEEARVPRLGHIVVLEREVFFVQPAVTWVEVLDVERDSRGRRRRGPAAAAPAS